EQQFHGELIEPLVRVAALPERREVKARLAQLGECGSSNAAAGLGEELLDLRIAVELRDFVLENQVRPHASGGKVPDAGVVLGAVGMAIEMPHPRPLRIFEQLDEKEGAFGVV